MLIISHPQTRRAERYYIYSVIFGEFLGVEYTVRETGGTSTVITMGRPEVPGSIILPDIFFSKMDRLWLTKESLPDVPLREGRLNHHFSQEIHQHSLPILYGMEGKNGEASHRIDDTFTSAIDIPGSIFFMLTRYEEAVLTLHDGHRRLQLEGSVLYEQGFTERPLVNEYVELLWGMMTSLWPHLQRKLRTYRLIPTHDIDVPIWSSNIKTGRLIRSVMADLVIRRDAELALKRYKSVTGGPGNNHILDPNNTYEFIMDCSEEGNVKSTFFFKAGRTSMMYDTDILVDCGWMRSLVRSVHYRGHEVGLHPSYETFDDAAMVRKEFDTLLRVCQEERIDQSIWGGRQHYLRWENPTTWQNYEDAGLAYDASLSFIKSVGFRTGCCYEYPCFNLMTRSPLKLRERPLIVMDSNIFKIWVQPTGMALEKIYKLASTCKTFRGDFTLLWHNSSLISKQQRLAYTALMKNCR
jgi:hypothetical protein